MKKLIFCLCIFILGIGCAMQPDANTTKLRADGFYQVDTLLNTAADFKTTANESTVYFDAAVKQEGKAIINLDGYVPLELQSQPTVNKGGNTSKLLLSLSPVSAVKLKTLTQQHLGQQAALVYNGKLLSVHRIKAVIADGKMEITSDNAETCAYLQAQLKNSVKK